MAAPEDEAAAGVAVAWTYDCGIPVLLHLLKVVLAKSSRGFPGVWVVQSADSGQRFQFGLDT